MNYKTMLKGALALSLSLMVGSAMASTTTQSDTQAYGETFESYAVDTVIGEQHTGVAGEGGSGWYAGEGDESKVIAGGPTGSTKALQLNTDAGVLTNLFASSVASDLNDGIAAAGAYFETEVKFVPSDTLDAGITGGQDATKFAIYAYANEDATPATTNLVVFHAYYDGNGDLAYINEVFGTVNCDDYTTLRVEMKKMLNRSVQMVNVFSVKVGDTVLQSELALDADPETPGSVGSWFMTVEDQEAASQLVSSLNFKGTGEIDNIKAGVITETTTYAIDWTGSQNVVVSNGTEEVSGTTGDYEADTVLTFYATVGLITNANDVALDPAAASWTYTVSADATFTVLAGEEPAAPTGFVAGDDVDGTITADQATWLNAFIDGGTYTKAQLEALTGWQDKYLLNVDPFNGAGTLTVTAITVGNDVQVSIALARTEDGTAISGNRAIKGVLKLYGTADLGTAFAECGSTTIVDNDFSEGNTTTATFTGTGKTFFKAVIEAPAAE